MWAWAQSWGWLLAPLVFWGAFSAASLASFSATNWKLQRSSKPTMTLKSAWTRLNPGGLAVLAANRRYLRLYARDCRRDGGAIKDSGQGNPTRERIFAKTRGEVDPNQMQTNPGPEEFFMSEK